MKSHRVDLVSLVLGIITVIAGFAAIRARLGNLINDRPDALVPLVVLGVGLLAVAVATRRIVHGQGETPDDRTI
ncbi:MAG TPA: hypothetical protein VHN36_15595 [Ilumatobacteraceae bacterium]|nr:hypothetical protein [Ilumatobacteraceae bacterium]